MRTFYKSIPKQEIQPTTKVTYETKTVTHKSVPFSTYHANGEIHEKGYRNAKEQLVGKLQTYYTSGTLKSEMHYFNGVLQGDCTHYNEEGTIKMQGKYAKGKKRVYGFILTTSRIMRLDLVMRCITKTVCYMEKPYSSKEMKN